MPCTVQDCWLARVNVGQHQSLANGKSSLYGALHYPVLFCPRNFNAMNFIHGLSGKHLPGQFWCSMRAMGIVIHNQGHALACNANPCYLPTEVRGIYFYLYLFVDLFSRRIVGWQVYDCESAELASGLLQAICERQGIAPHQLTVHSDNGSPMKGETMLATMQRLGVAASRSRPVTTILTPRLCSGH